MFDSVFPMSDSLLEDKASLITDAQTRLYGKVVDQRKAFRSSLYLLAFFLFPLLLTKSSKGYYDFEMIAVAIGIILIGLIIFVVSYNRNVKPRTISGKLKHNCVLLVYLQFIFNSWSSIAFYIITPDSSWLTYLVSQALLWVAYFVVCIISYRASYTRYDQIITKSASNAKFYLVYGSTILVGGIVFGSFIIRMLPLEILGLILCLLPPCLGIALSRQIMDLRYYMALQGEVQ